MDLRYILLIFALIYFITLTLAAPVDQKKPQAHQGGENEIEENVNEIKDDVKVDDDMEKLGLEYGRYLAEVVKTLDEDPDFQKKIENITHDQIINGHVASQIESVAPHIRNRLDELKRIEMDRLRKLAMQEHKLEEEIEHGAYNEEESGRRWRTVTGQNDKQTEPTKHLFDENNAAHIDHRNPHTFEVEDLQKLILKATKDIDEIERKRRRDFKQYEMEKELHYRDSLQNMTVEQKVDAEKKHEEIKKKHSEHAPVHHPGSKQQLEQVWEEQDNMPKQEFNPKIFFQMHDVNGDGFLDQEEVESFLSIEVRKLYNDKDPNFDRNEMMEEYHRMREHIYREVDANRDGLISKKEFFDYTQKPEFEKDEGWKGIEEAPVYTEEELKHYEQQRQALHEHYAKYGSYQMPYQPEMAGYQPVYYQVPHPGQQGQHMPQQPVQYVQVNAPPEHIQQPVQYQHVQLPPQHQVYQGQVPVHQQQQQQVYQGQQQHPQIQQQQQQQQMYIQHQPNNPNLQALPPAQNAQQQQQHPNQQGYQAQNVPQQKQQQQGYASQNAPQQQQQPHPSQQQGYASQNAPQQQQQQQQPHPSQQQGYASQNVPQQQQQHPNQGGYVAPNAQQQQQHLPPQQQQQQQQNPNQYQQHSSPPPQQQQQQQQQNQQQQPPHMQPRH